MSSASRKGFARTGYEGFWLRRTLMDPDMRIVFAPGWRTVALCNQFRAAHTFAKAQIADEQIYRSCRNQREGLFPARCLGNVIAAASQHT